MPQEWPQEWSQEWLQGSEHCHQWQEWPQGPAQCTEGQSSSSHAEMTPASMLVPLEWHQVKYVDAARTKLNVKIPPIEPPFPDMEFKGYDFSDDHSQVAAFFVRIGVTGPGTRRPKKGRSGVNSDFHSALQCIKRTKSSEDVEAWKRDSAHWYVPKTWRS